MSQIYIVDGVNLWLSQDEKEIDQMLTDYSICKTCKYSIQNNLFEWTCTGLGTPWINDGLNSCENHMPKTKIGRYWIDKLCQMSHDCNGLSDFLRELAFHEKNGTENIFLGFK